MASSDRSWARRYIAFIGHTVFASSTAASIGWPAGNPFQTEVAVANLAVGCLGVLCYWLKDNFWVATVIANPVLARSRAHRLRGQQCQSREEAPGVRGQLPHLGWRKSRRAIGSAARLQGQED